MRKLKLKATELSICLATESGKEFIIDHNTIVVPLEDAQDTIDTLLQVISTLKKSEEPTYKEGWDEGWIACDNYRVDVKYKPDREKDYKDWSEE